MRNAKSHSVRLFEASIYVCNGDHGCGSCLCARNVIHAEFEVGQWIDCIDSRNKPLEARVAALRPGEVLVHFDGWAQKWDEWLSSTSPRIGLFGTLTAGIPRHRRLQGPQPGDNLGQGRRMGPVYPSTGQHKTPPQ